MTRPASVTRRRAELARARRAYARAERKHRAGALGAWDLFLVEIRLFCAEVAARECEP
jgi:hypothetical protein